MRFKSFVCVCVFFTTFGMLTIVDRITHITSNTPIVAPVIPIQIEPEPINLGPFTVSHPTVEKFLNYTELVDRLKEWNKECPTITEVGTYGKTAGGTDLTFLRIGTVGKPKILIHACIHGNERLATGATLNMMGKMLSNYNKGDNDETWLINNRDIYFVPALSPDTYLKQRWVEGVDPNRNYPWPGKPNVKSASPIAAIRNFHEKMKFSAVMSGHTYGRVFLYPCIAEREDKDNLKGLANKMAELANYDARSIGPTPAGYEIDWYYWKGAVALLTEFGAGTHEQPIKNVAVEADRVYPAYLYFMRNAPEIKITPPSDRASSIKIEPRRWPRLLPN